MSDLPKTAAAVVRHKPCPWCLIRGHIVIECLLCFGEGWVKSR